MEILDTSIVSSLLGSIRQSFNDVFSASNAHYGGTGDFPVHWVRSEVYIVLSSLFAGENEDQCDLPNPPLEITIVSCHNIDAMFDDPINQAIIGIGAWVVAFDSFKSRVLSDTESQTILLAQLLQLGQHTICNDRDTLGIQAVHHGWNDIKLMLNGVRYEIGINKNGIRRREGRIILEKE